MNPIIASIMALLAPLSNAERALSMQNYMKNHFQFLGIASENWRKPLRAFLKQSPLPAHNDLKTNTLQLFQLSERELHYCGIAYLAYYKKLLLENDIAFLEQLITTHAWWDSVDSISSQLIAPFFQKYPALIAPVAEQWMNSDNIWLQRVCLIFQLSYKSQTNTALLANYCLRLSHSKEFFIAKAIGWALRQYARTDAAWVKTFIANHTVQPLSKREALKHLG